MTVLSSPDVECDSQRFVEALQQINDRLNQLLSQVFGGASPVIDRPSEKAVRAVLDHIVVAHDRCAEHFSAYIDRQLRAHMDDTALTASCQMVMTLVKRLRDKDVFEWACTHHLSDRAQAGPRSLNLEQERLVLRLIRVECGETITTKMERMLEGLEKSEEAMVAFNAARHADPQRYGTYADLHALTLASGSWPLSAGASLDLPPALRQCVDCFSTFYTAHYRGRRLNFLTRSGTVELRMVVNGKGHDLTLPTPLAAVLVLFPANESMSTASVANDLGVPECDVVSWVAALTRPVAPKGESLLKYVNGTCGSVPGVTPNTNTVVQFNANFRSRNLRVKLLAGWAAARPQGATAAGGATPTTASTPPELEDERMRHVDAAIVRIMKSRRVLKHADLIQQTIMMLQPRFLPTSGFIKRRIDLLITGEFLERASDNTPDVYRYLP